MMIARRRRMMDSIGLLLQVRRFVCVMLLLLCLWTTSSFCLALLSHHHTTTRSTTRPIRHFMQSFSNNDHAMEPMEPQTPTEITSTTSRRRFLTSLSIGGLAWSQNANPAPAALIQFPQSKPFANTYHLMRVGESLLEKDDIWSTNPLFLTNREDALSERGQEQVVAACQAMKQRNDFPTVIRYSLAAAAVDTSALVGRELQMGRDRLGAEFTFLDPRAIGKWDMLSKSETFPAVWALDAQEAGEYGMGGRPPPNTDGTPHETLADQVIRLRQLVSLLETQYSGDTVLLVFPDGTGPAVLSAMMAGIPLNRVHELEFSPGELRMDVRYDTVRDLWQAKQQNSEQAKRYESILEQGRNKLEELRSTESFVSLKDERIEAERIAIDEEYNQQQAIKEQKVQEKLDREQQAIDEQQRLDREQRAIKGQKVQQWFEGERLERNSVSQENEADNTPLILAAAGASFVAVLGGTQIGGSSNDQPDLAVTENGKNGLDLDVNVTAASVSSLVFLNDTGTLMMVTNTTTSVSNGEVSRRVNGSRGTMPELAPPKDPYEAAQLAMKDYMDQDDGGEAWLVTLSEMITDKGSEAKPEYELGQNKSGSTI